MSKRYKDTEEPKTDAKPAPDAKESNVVVLADREITLDAYIRGKGDLGRAFATSCTLESAKVVKLTRTAWDEKFKAWREKPRGGGK